MPHVTFSRRRFLATTAASAIAAPAILRASTAPHFTHGVQSGDVTMDTGMIWTRTDRPSRVAMEWATTESFEASVKLAPMDAVPGRDFSIKRLLSNLPSGQDIFYRFTATDLTDVNAISEPLVGRFRTAPGDRRSIRFAWSGDTAGQGWGIDDAGMMTYGTMAGHNPDFFIHSGDTIYADGPMQDEVERDGQVIWRNTTMIESKYKVAETLDEFRDQWKYNLMDRHVQAMNASVPTYFQWDDHEVVNNWSSNKDLTNDDRYTEKSVPLLTSRAAQAFHEMTPIRYTPEEPGRVYRKMSYGPLLDLFFIDLRSYRAGNNAGLQTEAGPETVLMGAEQIAWLKRELSNSRATWKVIASDMPIGLIVWDDWRNQAGVEAIANGDDGGPKGRELEIADLLRFIKAADIRNTVWFTADVHYTAAHFYDPNKAQDQDFNPFWEFVSGPLHAGTFGPNSLDMTFGPEVKFAKAPTEDQGANLPPSEGLQFFGLVDIDGESEAMTVRLMDRADTELYSVTLEAAPST